MIYETRKVDDDYLKYYIIVKRYFTRKYNLSIGDLDMILFLYSEQYFSNKRFKEYEELVTWDRNRFYRLRDEGWITTFRKGEPGIRAVYNLSYRGKQLVRSVYKIIVDKEIPEKPTTNPMFKRDVCYTDKVHRNYIKKLNKELKEKRKAK